MSVTDPPALFGIDPRRGGRFHLAPGQLVRFRELGQGSEGWAGIWVLRRSEGDQRPPSRVFKLFGRTASPRKAVRLLALTQLNLAALSELSAGRGVFAAPIHALHAEGAPASAETLVGYSTRFVQGRPWSPSSCPAGPYGDWIIRASMLLWAFLALRHRGVAQGDLQPSNVSLDPDGRPGIGLWDFDEAWSMTAGAGDDRHDGDDLAALGLLQRSTIEPTPCGEHFTPLHFSSRHPDALEREVAGVMVAVCQLLCARPVVCHSLSQIEGDVAGCRGLIEREIVACPHPLARSFVRKALTAINEGRFPWESPELALHETREVLARLVRAEQLDFSMPPSARAAGEPR